MRASWSRDSASSARADASAAWLARKSSSARAASASCAHFCRITVSSAAATSRRSASMWGR
jgi:hypothetical protein